MLRNLKAEMARSNIKPKDLSHHLGLRMATIYDKLNGHYDFSTNEAIKIKRKYFKEHSIEYLFEREGECLEVEE